MKLQLLENELFNAILERHLDAFRTGGFISTKSELVAFMIAYAVYDLSVAVKTKIVLESDLDKNIPKKFRESAISIALEMKIVNKIDYRGKEAYTEFKHT